MKKTRHILMMSGGNPTDLPPLTEEGILHWADLHFQRTGKYPMYKDGPVADAPGETWAAFDMALRYGRRGFPGGSSLAKLLAKAGKKAHRHHAVQGKITPPSA